MVDKKFREALNKYLLECDEGTILLENPAFDNSIIGITSDYRLVYDYDSMVYELAEDEDIEPIDAEDQIGYDTMRAIPYMGEKKPIILELKKETLIEMFSEEVEE